MVKQHHVAAQDVHLIWQENCCLKFGPLSDLMRRAKNRAIVKRRLGQTHQQSVSPRAHFSSFEPNPILQYHVYSSSKLEYTIGYPSITIPSPVSFGVILNSLEGFLNSTNNQLEFHKGHGVDNCVLVSKEIIDITWCTPFRHPHITVLVQIAEILCRVGQYFLHFHHFY